MNDKICENKTSYNKYTNTKAAIFSIFLYLLFSQFIVAIVPKLILDEYLLSHTIVISIILLTIFYLSLSYNPISNNHIKLNKLLLYITVGTIICIAVNYPYSIINKLHDKPVEYTIFMQYGLFARAYFLFTLVIIGPITEELLYRLYIYNMFKEDMSIACSTILSAGLYMLMHGKIQIVYLFIPGVVYALVYDKTRTIWSSVVVHGLNNLVWFSLVYYA